jgi:N-acetylneuraminic acid mutarotase
MTLGSRWKEYGNHVYDFYGNGLSSQSSVVYANKIFIIGGYSEVQVWNEQILEWEDAGAENRIMLIDSSKVGPLSDLTSPGSLPVGTSGHTSVVFNNKMWVIGGVNNLHQLNLPTTRVPTRKVYSSTDGSTWTEVGTNALPVATWGHSSVVFNSKMWVIGGYNKTTSSTIRKVYSSSDGITWTEAGTDALGLVGIRNHSSVVYDGKMWVIGGYTTGATRNVYYSTNGSSWTEAGTNALPMDIIGHTSVVFNNKMWVIGGSSSTYADSGRKVHSSPDGITWTEVGNNVLPTGISDPGAVGHTSVVFNGYMWVMGAGAANASVFQTTYSDTFFLVLPF